jgi:hypothetical protein
MNPTGRRPAVLNRAVFTNRTFDSRALSVLTTLVHRFVEPGHYDVFVRRNGSVVHRTQVDVAPDHARTQVNVDMANVPESKRAVATAMPRSSCARAERSCSMSPPEWVVTQ